MSEIAYLIVDKHTALIEPGSTATSVKLMAAFDRLGLNPTTVNYIIPTHVHVDHGGGSGYLAGQLPQARVVLHPRGAANLSDPAKLIQATKGVFGDDFEKTFGPILPLSERQIQVVGDRENLRLGKRDLTIIYAPGHASHHVAIFDTLTEGLYCGESLGIIMSTMPEYPLPAVVSPFDLALYQRTIDRLSKLQPKRLFYSHCGPYDNATRLIDEVRQTTAAFGTIVQEALRAGEGIEQVWQRLSAYVRKRFPEAALPPEFQFTISGYVSYFERIQRI